MKIIVGKNSGFCYGVKRAVEAAKEEVKKNNNNLYCLGEIVHNKDVIEELENSGIKFIDDISDVEGTVIIRAHGIKKSIYKIAEEKNIEIKDYTCPNVTKVHEIAQKYADEGFYIMLTGGKNHPENIGTMSFCGDNYFVIEEEQDVNKAMDNFYNSNIKHLLLISQTTYSEEKFANIKNNIEKNLNKDIQFIVKNTICAVTKQRQKEVEDIAKSVDKMIIIGGKNSSNTKKLYEIANKYCPKSICIQNVKELDFSNFELNDTIGIMAGASTPQKSIEEVVNTLNNK